MGTYLAFDYPQNPPPCEVRELREEDQAKVLALLDTAPVESVILRGLILDHGLCGAELRGVFYGYFADHQLTAVALIGHQIITFGAQEALPYFAQQAVQVAARGYLMLGPAARVEALWQHLAKAGRETRRVTAQRLYVCQKAAGRLTRLQLLRANYAELDVITDAQAEMALEASGIDPRQADLAGFRHRVAERLERKRVWVKIEDGKVVFKADIFSETPDTIYLEGVWVHPDYRQCGLGKSCLAELAHRLLKSHQTICLLSDEEETVAHQVYEYAGFVHAADYQARFLTPLA
ncbi:MAG: GNAT family N-acetyltransferase [Acidobacteria bacterium]|nr:GNAT family N-acetyltransferase [Acidobacteriota bacterium]